MSRRKKALSSEQPVLFGDHAKPVTRRDFLAHGLLASSAVVTAPTLLGLLAAPNRAFGQVATCDIAALKAACGASIPGAGRIPFICFDLAGGANIAGSNVLIGGQGGQMDFLSTAGYSKLGLPGDMIPPILNPQTDTNDFINTDLGLAFHSDSAFLRGILRKASVETIANVNGAVIPARSENDTGNNPHNPMYGIFKAGNVDNKLGALLDLIGTETSDSGGRSMAPESMIDPTIRPTKVDRTSDVTGLVDTGKLIGLLEQSDAVQVMEAMQCISDHKLNRVNTQRADDAAIKELVRCGYAKAAHFAQEYGDPSTLNPELDTDILGPTGVFDEMEFAMEGRFRKTAAVMKLVVNGLAGAGTIEMGGYDYHTGERGTGEIRDLVAGECMGACLEYAKRVGVPIMIYVFSDGSVASNGRIDDSEDGRGKGEWTGDNSSTASSFFLVYNPNGRAQLFTGDNLGPERHQQIGYMRPDASVETAATPAANNVNLLVETVLLNYMALHGEQNRFADAFPNHGLGNDTLRDSLTAFDPIVNGTLS